MSKVNELSDFHKNYVEPEDLQWADTALENMREMLEYYGINDAAAETYETLLVIRAHRNRMGVLMDRLHPLWSMIASIATGDCTKEQLAIPICMYRTGLLILSHDPSKWKSEPGRNIVMYYVLDRKSSKVLSSMLTETEALQFAYEYAGKKEG